MSTKHPPGADIKAASLKMQLHADSGYESSAEYRISADQWSRILSVAEDGKKGRLVAAAPDLLQELKNIANADTVEWDDPTEFEAWAKNRARAAIAKATGEQA